MTKVDMLKAVFLSALLAMALITGCSENECPEPGCCVPDPTLSNIWPNEDQTAWTYDYVRRLWDWPGFRIYDDIDSVPPIPTMDELENLLASHPIGDNPETLEGIYRLRFDGELTTLSGVTAQNLTELLCTTDDTPGLLAGTPARRNVFLEHLALARPDLRERIRHRLGVEPRLASSLADTFDTVYLYPLLLHGYAWEKSTEHIGTYGDLDTLLAWKFLDANLSVGHEFTHQLVPELADDVFLHCRIISRGDYETEVGVFQKAIECLYVVDYGLWSMIGIPSQWARNFDYGVVVYAPTVGPIYSYERMLVQPGEPLDAGTGDKTVSLIGASTP